MTTVRGERALAVVGTALAAILLSSCSSSAESTLTVQFEEGEGQTVSVSDLQCVTSGDRFTASSAQDRVGELSAFTASITGASDATTWISLGDDRWLLTTDAFEHDGAVTFDNAEARIGTSAEGYPAELETSATLDGTLTCTSQNDF